MTDENNHALKMEIRINFLICAKLLSFKIKKISRIFTPRWEKTKNLPFPEDFLTKI